MGGETEEGKSLEWQLVPRIRESREREREREREFFHFASNTTL